MKRWVRRAILHNRRLKICAQLRNSPRRKTRKLKHGELTITIPAQGLAVIELK